MCRDMVEGTGHWIYNPKTEVGTLALLSKNC